MEWKAKIGEQEYTARSDDELRQWYREGRLRPDSYVFNALLGRWMYAREVEELRAVTPQRPRAKTSAATWGVVILLVVGAAIVIMTEHAAGPSGGALTGTAANRRSHPPDPKPLENLNGIVRKQMRRNLYTSYSVEGTTATIQINPSLWNRLSTSEQRQLCDIVARGTFMESMNLRIARLRVLETTIGLVLRSADGSDQRFEPELKSLE